MILANDDETSFCSVSNLTGHTETNIWLINKFIKKNNNIKISKNNNLINIETNGINLF
jgi:RNA 3'-terminal phosphate cyclase